MMDSRIIVVEDEPELLEMLCHVLENEGFTVTPFGEADLDRMTSGDSSEFFLIDLMLPDIDGIELAARLRSAGFDRSRLVGISASSTALRDASRSGHFQHVLAKPFDLSELMSCFR